MTDCSNARMRDALPDLLHDRLTPGARADCLAHVAECADCAAEVELLRSARAALGRVPVLDVSAIVRALPTAPPREATLPPSMRRGGWSRAARWRAAAGLALVAGGAWLAALGDGPSTAGVVPGATLAAGGSAASSAPAREPAGPAPASGAIGGIAGESAAPSASDLGVSVADLSDDELEAVLRAMDGGDALPSVDPLPTLTPIGAEGDA